MKKTKQFLEQALRSLPNDQDLKSARSHILAAFNHINDAEMRRARKENIRHHAQQIEDQRFQTMFPGELSWKMSLPQVKLALKNLDQMISDENNKIAEIKAEPKKSDQKPDNIMFD